MPPNDSTQSKMSERRVPRHDDDKMGDKTKTGGDGATRSAGMQSQQHDDDQAGLGQE